MCAINWAIVLDFFRIFLSPQVIAGSLILFALIRYKKRIGQLGQVLERRLAKSELKAETAFGNITLTQAPDDQAEGHKQLTEESIDRPDPVADLDTVRELYKAELLNSRLWEYRYANFFFVRDTQLVLDWFYGLKSPINFSHFHNTWMNVLPVSQNREAILTALNNHFLVVFTGNNLLSITDKGKEYVEWRGLMPPAAPTPPAKPVWPQKPPPKE